ncbi:MAG: alpha/beta fold hydrolase [Flavobacteriales bacterium]|nr:alpha/beta fold hydrolase [Flavobacteriales bacterium]
MNGSISPPSWLSVSEYPFASNAMHHPDGRIHYVDEGEGPVILFVHGTPDWSFGFRHLIKAFRNTNRCIALDHLGFGLSDKPSSADYTVKAHARRLQDLIDHLGLKDITLVVTDFGGGIGLQHALDHPENVRRIVLYNTWMWDLLPDKRFSRPFGIMSSWFGRMLYRHMGFSVNVMMPNGYGDRKKLTKDIHAHYKQALPDAASRAATFACVQEIGNAGPFWNAQWARVDVLHSIPTLIAWGMKDRFFPPDLLERWKQALPHASVVTFPEAGHFVHEEAAAELGAALRELLLP